MDPYQVYAAEDFAAIPSFQNWARMINPQDIEFWKNWLATYPERMEVCLQAKVLVLAVYLTYQDEELSEQDIQQHIHELVDKADSPTPIHSLGSTRWWRWQVAAAILLLATGVWFIQQDGTISQSTDQHAEVMLAPIKRFNSTTRLETILLSDGSVVTLSPQSSLSYPRIFAGEKRLVNLVGEAFFDVKKNPKKPFFVLTNRSVTKVLGTSFRIKAYPKDPVVNVMVRTGKVAVYAFTTVKEKVNHVSALTDGVLLTPNQQVEINQSQLKKVNISHPKLVAAPQVGPSEITFEDQPVANVLLTLARLYEVHIEFDSQQLANCRITTTFANETLPERLNSICQAINASFTIENDQINVSGHGCISSI